MFSVSMHSSPVELGQHALHVLQTVIALLGLMRRPSPIVSARKGFFISTALARRVENVRRALLAKEERLGLLPTEVSRVSTTLPLGGGCHLQSTSLATLVSSGVTLLMRASVVPIVPAPWGTLIIGAAYAKAAFTN